MAVQHVLWLGPALFAIAAVVLYPIVEMVRTSFSDVSLSGVIRGFNGVDNYADLFRRPEFTAILGQTALWVSTVVIGTIALAWPLALLLNAHFPGRRAVRYAVLIPWATALSVSALIFQWMFNYTYGVVNTTLIQLGLIASPIDWFGDSTSAWTMLIILGIFVSVPFSTYIILGALQSIPDELYEAARLDGAGPIRSWMSITLPMARTSTFLAVVLNLIGVFNSFALIWVLTGGGPGRSTQTTFTFIYTLAFGSQAMGESAALSVVNILLLGGVIAIVLVSNRKALEDLR